MENLIGDILSTLSFKSAVYFKYGFCKPWGMDISKGPFSQFHLVTHGNCTLQRNGENLDLEKGDLIIFPKGDPHQIKSDPQAACRPGVEVLTEILNGTKLTNGQNPATHLICGHYEMDQEVSHPVFDKLPPCIIIKSSEYGRFDLIYSIFELIVEEMTVQKAGYETVSLRLAEILFISIIRHYYLLQAKEKANLFKDKLIYTVVDLIHKDLATDWSIEKMARQAGISRTLFIERFKQAAGITPMKYINNWRMTKAKYLLKNSDFPLSQIGEKIGYHSESSFNRAFKQKYAVSPGKFRLLRGRGD